MGGAGAGKELDEDVVGKMRRTDYGQVCAVSDFSWRDAFTVEAKQTESNVISCHRNQMPLQIIQPNSTLN
jgi:hypothetical protein